VGPGTSPVAGGEVVYAGGTQDGGQVSGQVVTVKLDVEKIADLLDFCSEAKSRNEMQEFCGISSRNDFSDNILKPLLKTGRLKRTIQDKPNSSKQKYIRG